MYLSKSRYCDFWQCPKLAWLKQYKPEAAEKDASAEARMKSGNEVGDLAMGLFGDFVEVTARNEAFTHAEMERLLFKTRDVLLKNRAFLEAVTDALVEKGTLLYSDIRTLRESHPVTPSLNNITKGLLKNSIFQPESGA